MGDREYGGRRPPDPNYPPYSRQPPERDGWPAGSRGHPPQSETFPPRAYPPAVRRKAAEDGPPPYWDPARNDDRSRDYDRTNSQPQPRGAYASSRSAAPPSDRYDGGSSRADAWDGAGAASFRGGQEVPYRPPRAAPPMRSTLEWDASTGWRERLEPDFEREPYRRPASPRRYREERRAPPQPPPPPPGLSRHAHLLLPAPPPAPRPRSPPPPPAPRDLHWEKILEASQRAPPPPPPCPSWIDGNSRERVSARSAAWRFTSEPPAPMPRNAAPAQVPRDVALTSHGDNWFVRVPLPQTLHDESRARDEAEPAAADFSYSDSLDDAEYEPKRQRLGWGQGLARNADQDAVELAADMRVAEHEERRATPPFFVPPLEVSSFEQAERNNSPTDPRASTPPPPVQPMMQPPPLPTGPEPPISSLDVPDTTLASKSTVLCEIDRVDADITDLEARLRKLIEADLEEDEELAEDAAARLPPPRSRPRRPPPPRVFAVPPHDSAAADAFAAMPAAAVLAALESMVPAPAIELLSTSNAGRAASAAEVFGLTPLSPVPLQPFDSTALLARNTATHARLRAHVTVHLARCSAARRAQHTSLALEYCQRQARWVTALAAHTDVAIRWPDSSMLVTAPGNTAELAAERAAERERMHARLPVQLSVTELSMRAFPGRNALVHAPAAAAADEARVRPWSAAERRTFLDKFSLYGKDFARIATHLAARSTADCVVYYYRTQKVDDGFGGKRKAALKKRRQYAAAAAMGFGAVAAFRDADAGRQRERAAPTAEARQEKAALAAAARAAAVSKEKAARAGRGGGAKRRERDADEAVPLTAAEVARVLDALPRTGKRFKALASATGVTVSSLKSFWTSHSTTYGLEALAAQASGGIAPGAGGLSVGHQKSPVPEVQQAAGHSVRHVSVDALRTGVSAFADALLPGGDAGTEAAERARHPLLTAVQFIRTHANAQLRDDRRDVLETAAADGLPEGVEPKADDHVEDADAHFVAPIHDGCLTDSGAAQDVVVGVEPDLGHEPSSDGSGDGDEASMSVPQEADASIDAGDAADD